MSSIVFKYYCQYCKQYVVGDSLEKLCGNLNRHNDEKHPMEWASWRSETIMRSANYMGMGGPMPEYLEPYGTTSKRKSPEWGDAAKAPDITERDKIMLLKGHVKWD